MIELEKTADDLPWLGGDERWVTSVAAVRAIDADAADAGLPTAVLMENAGRSLLGVCEALRERAGAIADVVIGPGANGGDGLVLARHLVIRGWRVRVVHGSSDGIRPDPASAPWRSAQTAGVPMFTPAAAGGSTVGNGLVVDAVFGVGLSRPPQGEARELVEYVNGRGGRRHGAGGGRAERARSRYGGSARSRRDGGRGRDRNIHRNETRIRIGGLGAVPGAGGGAGDRGSGVDYQASRGFGGRVRGVMTGADRLTSGAAYRTIKVNSGEAPCRSAWSCRGF